MNLSEITPREPDWMPAFRRGWWSNFQDQYQLRYSFSQDRLDYRWTNDRIDERWYELVTFARQNYVDQGNDARTRQRPDQPDLIEMLP